MSILSVTGATVQERLQSLAAMFEAEAELARLASTREPQYLSDYGQACARRDVYEVCAVEVRDLLDWLEGQP